MMQKVGHELGQEIVYFKKVCAEIWWRSVSQHFRDLHFKVKIWGKIFVNVGDFGGLGTIGLWITQITQTKTRKLQSVPRFFVVIIRIPNIQHVGKSRAGKSWRAVLSDPENLEYDINIYRRHKKGSLVFMLSPKELKQLKDISVCN